MRPVFLGGGRKVGLGDGELEEAPAVVDNPEKENLHKLR